MYKLVINENEYQLPDKLTVRQWMAIASENKNFTDYKVNMVKSVLGCSSEEAHSIPEDTVDLVVSFILVMFHQNEFNRNDEELIDFSKLTFGQWIDLDVYLSLGLDKHFTDVVNVLFDTTDGEDRFFNDVMDGVSKYINYRSHIYTQYKELFGSKEEEVDDNPKPAVHPAKVWQSILATVADDDITKFDQILEMPLISVFNFMAYKKEQAFKQYLEAQKQRQ